jgi:Cu(I)/Ag(I) efflux system membrane fusion protein
VAKRLVYVVPLLVCALLGFVLGQFRLPVKASSSREPLYYVDPMHPSYKSSKPGIAPDCGMELVPVYADDLAKQAAASAAKGTVSIDSATQQLYGIQLAKVARSSGVENIRVLGRVAADETRVYHLNLGSEGYVKETHDDAVGNFVKKDQHLAVVYSPEFLTVVGGYLSASERSASSSVRENTALNQNAASAEARADRLRILGMSDAQIEEISETRKIPEDIYVVSPTDGFILSRSITPGQRFERHDPLYTIADLSHVWIIAEVFGKDAQSFRPGTMATATKPDTGEVFHARVSNVLPQVDPSTRTLKVRLELDNPRYELRPDMFVNVELPVSHPRGLTVPVDAVMQSGLHERVFVKTDNGFEPREVLTGWRLDDRVEIVSGLKEDETVVSAGTFLIDSESRLQIASGSAVPGQSRRAGGGRD